MASVYRDESRPCVCFMPVSVSVSLSLSFLLLSLFLSILFSHTLSLSPSLTYTLSLQFLLSLGFVMNTIPADYLNRPPNNEAAAKQNLKILRKMMRTDISKGEKETVRERKGEKERDEERKGEGGERESEGSERGEDERDLLENFLEATTRDVYLVLDRFRQDLEYVSMSTTKGVLCCGFPLLGFPLFGFSLFGFLLICICLFYSSHPYSHSLTPSFSPLTENLFPTTYQQRQSLLGDIAYIDEMRSMDNEIAEERKRWRE